MMMRSLTFKLTVGFCFVSLVGVVIVAILASRITQNEVNSLLNRHEQESIARELGDIYEEEGSWDNVNIQIADTYSPRHFVIVDRENFIILPGLGLPRGQRVPPNEAEDRITIRANGERVGYLVSFQPGQPGKRTPPPSNNDDILSSINRNIIYGALAALVISSAVGVFGARQITKPILELTTASQNIASGDLSQEVAVRSRDEIGQLASSFNKMSADLVKSQKQRQQMTADIAHDLRTPLSLILGHAEAIEDGVLPATPETLHIIHDEAKRLNGLIEDLRTLTLADTGQLTLDKRKVKPVDMMNRAGYAHKPLAREKNIEININVTDGLPEIEVDPRRIGQVLDNLVSNAIQYTPPDENIWLEVKSHQEGLYFSVKDSGPGIPESDLAHIFDRFYRADKSRNRDEGGSGLGLAIARSLIMRHNGRIWAESQVGIGTNFQFILPVVA
ncbi:MAG: ATP-binding protein [Chloroflexota bacterium]